MCKEKYYDDNGVELLPGDVVVVWNSDKSRRKIRPFLRKNGSSYYCNDEGRVENFQKSNWDYAEFYARPPAKQKYVRSRKEVAQILLDDGYEPGMSGYWSKACKDTTLYLKETKFTDCGKKLSDCQFDWDEKFLIER